MRADFNLLLWCTSLGDAEFRRCERLAQMGWDGVEVPFFEGTVEAFGRALPDIAAATRAWRPFFDDDDQLAPDALKLVHEAWDIVGKGQ